MNHIGRIIKQCRYRLKMSQSELAAGLCTSNEINLIEIGQCSPSAELLGEFSNRLGADLIEMYRFNDCIDPMDMYETIRMFDQYKMQSEYAKLNDISEIRKEEPDFLKWPWRSEILINKYVFLVLEEYRGGEAIPGLLNTLTNMEEHQCPDFQKAQVCVLLTAAYLQTDFVEQAARASNMAISFVKGKDDMCWYRQIVVMARLSYLFVLLRQGDYKNLIDEAEKLLAYQQNNSLQFGLRYTYFLLALGLYMLDDIALAKNYCRKTLASFILEDNRKPDRFITKNATFAKLVFETDVENTMLEVILSAFR